MGTILVVDDDPGACRSIARVLRDAGHQPYTVNGGHDAVTLLLTVAVDVVVLDLVMPDVDGFDVLRTIRGNPRLCGQKVIVYSALASVFASDPRLAAADRVLSKSVPVSRFVSEVTAVADAGRR